MLRIEDRRGSRSGTDKAMKRFLAQLIAALGVAFGAPLAHADILIGVPAPITGPLAWGGEELERGAKMAVTQLNAAGGVLGQKIQAVMVDDYCDPEQAVAAANKLVADGVDVVIGHLCSGAAVPASKVYAQAGILMMTPAATTPLLTEQGLDNVFRFCGRDDQVGTMAGAYLAEHWATRNLRSSTTDRSMAKASPKRPRKR
jgi:branched-chain amino acid transport system substrate-binding protein